MRAADGALALAAVAALAPAPAPAAGATPEPVARLADPAITESSGLVASRLHEGVLWTHNDGDEGVLYAVDRRGRTLATYSLGVDTRDWEALGYGTDDAGRPALFVADIGDNGAARTRGVLVHRVREPARLDGGTLAAESYRLRYATGPVDAETLLVGPGRQLRVVSKGLLGGWVYAAPDGVDPDGPTVLERVGPAPALVTDGAVLPDGRYVLRDYGAARVFGPDGVERAVVELPRQEQGESLAVTPDGAALLVGSEGVDSPVWQVPLPVPAPAPAPPARSPDAPTARPEPPGASPPGRTRAPTAGGPYAADQGDAVPSLPVLAGAVAAVLAVGALLRARRR